MKNTPRIQFFYLKTGGGHLAPAKALAQWILKHKRESAQISLNDGFDGAPKIVRKIVEDGYKHSQANGKWMFEFLYAIHKLKFFARLTSWLVSVFIISSIEKRILAENPSKIIIFHFFLIRPILQVVKKRGLKIPVLTVVTDPFTAHPIWFLQNNQHFVVFSKELQNYLLKVKNVNPSKVSVFPFIVKPEFSIMPTLDKQHELRERLNIMKVSKVILIMGGGDGIPRGAKLLKHLALSNVPADIIMVAGRNKRLFNKAIKIKQIYGLERLHVFGFIDFVYDLLSISDVVITKCGASTFAEVLISGKIPLVNSYIWEQEKGNVDYIRNNGMGVYEPSPKRISQLAKDIICNELVSWKYQQNISRMKLSNGTPLVSDFILQY
ncbi:MAG: glycosyltransferase [Perlabentimonas sp.]